MKVNIIFPFPPKTPAGGTRVLFEYANHLTRTGHEVTIYYSLSAPYYVDATPFIVRYVYYTLFMPPKWFKLYKGIRRKLITKVSNSTIDNGDVILYTWWALSYDVKKLDQSKGNKYNLIQDLEFWNGNEALVKETYFFPEIKNVVIAEYIRKYINSIRPVKIDKVSFAIDGDRFHVTNPIEMRNPFSVGMMYSAEPRKGSKIGLLAVRRLKELYPQLEVNLFSTFDFNEYMGFEVNFYKMPPDLPLIMNRSSIFISPSVQEGCALPPMEAMHCGNALVCSDIEGHSEYAFDNDTALLFKSQDVDDLVLKVSLLIENDEQRQLLAKKGNEFIKKNTWEFSTNELVTIFEQNEFS